MESERFASFYLLISGIYKEIQRIESHRIKEMELKSVHVLWLYLLQKHPEGLSAAELARRGDIDRSLVSREIGMLVKRGYLTASSSGCKRKYNWKLALTEKGSAVAKKISEIAMDVQTFVDRGLSMAELSSFYRVLEHISVNMAQYLPIRPQQAEQIQL